MDIVDYISNAIFSCLESLSVETTNEDIKEMIEVPNDKSNGDFSFPCFRLSKIMRNSPNNIATMIKEKIVTDGNVIKEIQCVNGFLNFYISSNFLIKQCIDKFDALNEKYGESEIGKDKTIVMDYSAPNIAKPFHIGHLKNTVLGHALYNCYKSQGYKTISINHLGDYGTQFAKLIEGYKRWGSEYDFSENPIEKLADIYKRINTLCESDESVLEECRATFKKLEDGGEYEVELWKRFKELSMIEFEKIYSFLGIEFDDVKGESFYQDKIAEVIDLLEKSGKLTESEGAKIVDLEDVGINTPCIIEKSNGSSIYATRDLAAILYRARTYDFDKCLYVVGNEQSLHFKQLFAVAKYLGVSEKCLNGLEHVAYGFIRLPEGKMSTRKGNFIKAEDVINESKQKVHEILNEKHDELSDEEIENISNMVAISAVIFENLKESRIKDQVFDIAKAVNFSGETGPYVQYMAVRTKSVLNKANYNYNKDIDLSAVSDESSITLLKLIDKFNDVINNVLDKNDPFYLVRYLLDLSKTFSSFYDKNKILCDDEKVREARLYLTYMTNITLTNGLSLLGIEVPNKM